MLRYSINLLVAFLIVTPAFAVEPFPSSFGTQGNQDQRARPLHVRNRRVGAPRSSCCTAFGDNGAEHVGRQPPRRW